MPLVDTHCHLTDRRFDPDREEVLERARQILDWMAVIGEDPEGWEAALALAAEDIHVVLGLHPYHAEAADEARLARLRELAGAGRIKAIGEIGLDYFNEFAPRPAQHLAFRAQLELAAELGMPVVVHNREADVDALPLLQEFAPRLPAVVLHCYGSDAAFAGQCVEAGFYISFAGNVTYPKAQKLRDAALVVPPERLLVETDGPYLAPQTRRGQRCEPAFVRYTADELAQLKGIAPEELDGYLTDNARRVFLSAG